MAWNKVTINDLIRAVELSASEMDELDKQVAVLSIFTGKTEDELWDMPKDKYLKLASKYNWISELPKETNVKTFEAGGYTWHPQKDISKITLGQYIDLTTLLKDPVNNIPEMLAVVCEPVKHYPLFIKIRPKMDFKQKTEILGGAKAEDAYSLSLFFCRVLIHLTKDMLPSLEKSMKEMMNRAKQTSNGDGR